MASAEPHVASATANQEPHLEGDLRHVPLSDTTMQLAIFAGLGFIFTAMVTVLFRKYRGRKKAPHRDALNDGYYNTEGTAFTPAFFSSESTPSVLVAHHDNDLRLFITNTLRLNYRVISTPDGGEAYDKAVEMVPDLIITDRMMPGMDGPLLCRKLKSTETTSHIPIIILTSQEKDLMTPDWHALADDLMFTSFDARELLMRVHNLISARKKSQEEYRENLKSYPALSFRGLPEEAFLRKVMKVLEGQYANPSFGVERLSSELEMSRLQLYRKIKALTNFTPGDFIRQFRLEQAKQRLLAEGASVSEVASKSGFNSLSAFTRAFKDHTGITPVEFAESNKTSDESLIED